MVNERASEELQRVPLSTSQLALGDCICTELSILSMTGASGLVYAGKSYDYYGASNATPARLVIKECYPAAVAHNMVRCGDTLRMSPSATEDQKAIFSQYIQRFKRAFDSNIALYQNTSAREQISIPDRVVEANGTVYIVNNASNGDTLDVAFSRISLYQRVQVLVRLCEALAAIHAEGFVHLDIKPENVLCIRNADTNSNEGYYADIRLFDFDSVTSISELGNIKNMIPSSGDWSSFEQTHSGHESDLGTQSDIYSVGALLFWVVFGRPPTSNEVIHAHGSWRIGMDDFSSELQKMLTEDAVETIKFIFNKTLVVSSENRFATASEAAIALKQLGELVMPVGNTMASKFDSIVAGQIKNQKLLEQMLQLLQGGTVPSLERDEVVECKIPDQSDVTNAEIPSRSEDDVFAIASETILLASKLAKMNLNGVPDSLSKKLIDVSESAKEALRERDAEAALSLSKDAEIFSNAAMILSEVGLVSSLEGCPKLLREAFQKEAALIEKSVDDLSFLEVTTNRLEASIPLLIEGTKLFLTRDTLKKYLSDVMVQQVDNAIDMAVEAFTARREDSINKAALKFDELQSSMVNDAKIGMITALL